jgi:hypothetical protein
MQFNGVNYMMSVDAKLDDEANLYRFAKIDDLLGYLQQVKALNTRARRVPRQSAGESLKRSIGATAPCCSNEAVCQKRQ